MKTPAITLKASAKPRNPLVAAAMQRRAGRHGLTGRGIRQRSARSLQRELEQLARKDSP